MVLVVLNIALAGFTGLLAWFLKELWALWKEERIGRDALVAHIEKLNRDMIESAALLREVIGELRLELAKNYVSSEEFKDFRDKYARPSIYELRERVSTIEGKGYQKEAGA